MPRRGKIAVTDFTATIWDTACRIMAGRPAARSGITSAGMFARAFPTDSDAGGSRFADSPYSCSITLHLWRPARPEHPPQSAFERRVAERKPPVLRLRGQHPLPADQEFVRERAGEAVQQCGRCAQPGGTIEGTAELVRKGRIAHRFGRSGVDGTADARRRQNV